MNWRLLICCYLALIISLAAIADTLVVAGHAQPLTVPLIVEKDEVLAPVVPALRLLGARTSANGASVSITMPGRAAFTVAAGLATTTVDGRRMTLPVAPREVGRTLYLPMKALATLLNAQVQYEAGSRTLTVTPLLAVSYELRREGLVVLVRSAAPLQYASGNTDDPPRVFFDFKHAALGMAEQQIPVNAGRVERVRVSQHSLSPSTVRLVVDCFNPSSARATVEEQGRLVTILIDKPAEKPAPGPKVPDAPSSLAPVQLTDISLATHAPAVSELTIITGGPAEVECAYRKETRQVTLVFRNGMNALPANRLREQRDAIIERVDVTGTGTETGAKLTITLKQDAGYRVLQDSQRVRILVGTFDLSDMVVVLDAGHGGGDTGAVGVNGTCEKTVNLDVILRAGKLLEREGAKVIYTRDNDTFIPLNDRPGLANQRGADVFISVHCNSMPTPNSASGTQTYYQTPQSTQLAPLMHEELVNGLGLKNGGVRKANFLVIRKSRMPSVLLELAFINNTREEALLASPDFRQKAAEAIVNGLRRYAATRDWQQRSTQLPPSLDTPEVVNTVGNPG